VEISATPIGSLDSLGRVIDFSVLKERIGGWIDDNWDHTTILSSEDVTTIQALKNLPRKKELFILPYNPTAENLAKYLLWEVCPKLLKGAGVIVYKVVFRETDNCYAEQSCEPTDPKISELYGIR
jgi:6-pyruvoyltetrahydropterin/6-carboxytetrahydropterin synthase